MDVVDVTLKLWRSSPFVWGGVLPHRPGHGDCMLSIGEYLASCGLPDRTAQFRGTYGDEAGALAHVARYDGIAGLMALTGLETTDEPQRGDVCCVATDKGEIGAICTGASVAARLERGVCEVDRRLIKITQSWKVP